MCIPFTKSSPLSIEHQLSFKFNLPSRRDLTSVPTSSIPVSKVSYGFAAGGSDLPSKSSSELFGGGTGGGVTIQPIAFIVVANVSVETVPF